MVITFIIGGNKMSVECLCVSLRESFEISWSHQSLMTFEVCADACKRKCVYTYSCTHTWVSIKQHRCSVLCNGYQGNMSGGYWMIFVLICIWATGGLFAVGSHAVITKSCLLNDSHEMENDFWTCQYIIWLHTPKHLQTYICMSYLNVLTQAEIASS